MKIYFSCSLTGGRQDQPVYEAMVRHLQSTGHDVLTAHLAAPDVVARDGAMDPVDVYNRDSGWVEACDVLVAEVTTPSHGVGYEIAYALDRGKPVLCFHREGVRVSSMLTGNRRKGMEVRSYSHMGQVETILAGFLGGMEKSGLLP